MQNQFSLNGKIALETGASYGIGFAIASALAEAGATIVFNDLKQEFVDKGLAAYKEAGIASYGDWALLNKRYLGIIEIDGIKDAASN